MTIAMAIRNIIREDSGDPVLRTRTADIDPAELGTERFGILIEDMVETMKAANGVGLAAPQIGESKRVFVAQSPDGIIAVVNPTVVKRSWKTESSEEGCLSIPGKFERLNRAKEVTVEGLNLNGSPVTIKGKKLFARILQHEIDHLDGILFVDRLKEQREKGI